MRIKLHWQILIALALAVPAGILAGKTSSLFGITFMSMFVFTGTLFMNALKMIIVPLVMSSIITGIASAGAGKGLGRLGGKTIVFYITSSFLAITTGLLFVNLLTPGLIDGEPLRQVLGMDMSQAKEAADKVGGRDASIIADVFLSMVPPNIVEAASKGQMLGLIFFSLLFGYFMTRIDRLPSETMKNFWQGLFDIMLKITELVMMFAPIGIFGLVAQVVAEVEPSELGKLAESTGKFFITVVLALAVHVFITLPLALKFIARVNPLRHYQAMSPALLTAFSTASSSAALPLTMDCVKRRAGVSNRTTSFVLPLGATINMDGTALYECVAAVFIAQAYGLDLSIGTQFLVVTIALLTSIGVAAVPAASLVAIAIILAAIGLPAEGIGLLLAVDRILDMLRTATNVFSDSCAAVVIASSEGEKNLLSN